MSSFRTSSLFHYTRDLDKLKGILEHGLIPNFCAEDLTHKEDLNKKTGLYIGLPMVSFCDIPISKTKEHSERYGNFAIGLKKDWAEKKNINPIMYAYNDNVLKAVSYICSVLILFIFDYYDFIMCSTVEFVFDSPIFKILTYH